MAGNAGVLTVTAFAWVPEVARGYVRDLRVRWACEEAGLPYSLRLVDFAQTAAAAYRVEQPFGQVPVLHDGDLVLFESGAILLHLADRVGVTAGTLLPGDPAGRASALCWLFAALNTVEIVVGNLAEADVVLPEGERAQRRAQVLPGVEIRLGQLDAALGERDYLAGTFSIADIVMADVLRGLDHTDLLSRYPTLAAYHRRCLARPAFGRALAAQLADFRPDPVA